MESRKHFEDRAQKLNHCLRTNGSERAWFYSRQEAEAFAKTNRAYHGDIAHLCAECDYYHLSKECWLEPQFTQVDYQMLEAAGIGVPRALCCELCRSVQQEGEEFFILTSGALRCSKCADA